MTKISGHYSSIHLLAFAGAIAFLGSAAQAQTPADATPDPVRVYPATTGEPLSKQFTVSVAGHDVPVYLAPVMSFTAKERLMPNLEHDKLGHASFASFDLQDNGSAVVTVTYPDPVTAVKLLPTSSGITPQVKDNTVTFTVSKPGQFVVEINGDWLNSLQVFVNPWDVNAPDPSDPNVIYYGPGIHKVSSVKVASGKTVYIAGDAIVYGTMDPPPSGAIFDLQGNNITIRGRGIIDGSLCPHGPRNMIRLQECRNVTIEGVMLRDSGAWTIPIMDSDHVTVKNVKIIGHRGNSDGIDVNNSRDVGISDCYIRTGDDLIVIKTLFPDKEGTSRVTATHCVLWNELAHALSIGAELRRDVSDIHFSDCDIIHDKGREWLLRVYHCDAGRVHDVTFDNIRIEECRSLIALWIGSAVWSKDPDRGHINDITFRNITSTRPEQPGPFAELRGYDTGHAIHGVTFDNVTVDGQPLTLDEVKQKYADGVTVTP